MILVKYILNGERQITGWRRRTQFLITPVQYANDSCLKDADLRKRNSVIWKYRCFYDDVDKPAYDLQKQNSDLEVLLLLPVNLGDLEGLFAFTSEFRRFESTIAFTSEFRRFESTIAFTSEFRRFGSTIAFTSEFKAIRKYYCFYQWI